MLNFHLARLALQNVNKDYVIFCSFITLSLKLTNNKNGTKQTTNKSCILGTSLFFASCFSQDDYGICSQMYAQ